VRSKLSGVFAAVPTPFETNGEPNIELFLEHCDWALENGCDGLNVLGTTGEANSQERKSREHIMRSIAKSTGRRGSLMVGTGTPSLSETIHLTTLAAELKFDAALVLPPYYYKPLPNQALFNYLAKVIESVASSDIGIYLYNFPQLTGIGFPEDVVAMLLEDFPNHLKGIKDSSGNIEYASNLASTFSGAFDVFPSSETCLSEARQKGFAGCISASVNATAPLAAKVWRESGTVSSEDLLELQNLRTEIASVPIVAAVKALVSMRTGRQEWLQMMPPLTALTGPETKKVEVVAERLGYKSSSTGVV
jgi:4-hydroxy-tetrahydrodipicolinate synthase